MWIDTQSIVLISVIHNEVRESHHSHLHHLVTQPTLQPRSGSGGSEPTRLTWHTARGRRSAETQPREQGCWAEMQPGGVLAAMPRRRGGSAGRRAKTRPVTDEIWARRESAAWRGATMRAPRACSQQAIFPRIHVKDPYQRLGISREASEEEIRAARNFLISKYAGHKPSVDAIESSHDRIIMQSFFDRKKPKMNLKKKFRELSQSRAVKAIQGRFQTPSSRVIWQTAITFVLLGVLTLVFPSEEGPTLQVAISCAANIYFIYQRLRSGWKAFFYGFGSFFASWLLGTFLLVSVIPPILPGPRNLEVSTACVTYALLFVSSALLK